LQTRPPMPWFMVPRNFQSFPHSDDELFDGTRSTQ
jgi:hypothetical protein